MPSFIDLTSQKFNKLTVLERAESNTWRVMWKCICECGGVIITRGYSLRTGHTVSCGCVSHIRLAEHRYRHGMSKSIAYRIWVGIKNRCSNINHQSYGLYGGRGISISDDWLDFQGFYKDMGDPPAGCSIERINNDFGYSKYNCRWATSREQSRNKRTNIRITWGGEEKILSDWATHLGVKVATLYERVVRQKWTIERAFTTPVQKRIIVTG